MLKILIVSDNEYLCESDEKPKVGKSYLLDDAVTGTLRQNRTFHALVSEYHKSNMHNYKGCSFAEFKDLIKRDLGEGFDSYVYACMIDGKARVIKVKCYEEIPDDVRKDPEASTMIRGKLKSWTDYTMKQRRETIDKVISEMLQVGVNTKKFEEILKGMEDSK